MISRWTPKRRAVVWSAMALVLGPSMSAGEDVVLADAYARRFQQDRVKFDSVRQVLLAFGGPHDRDAPAVVWVQADGQRGGHINPLKDFPEADAIDIWDVAAGPDSIVVAAVVQAGERLLRQPPKHVLLTYDLTGVRRALWYVNPYHHHKIAVDAAGNVYAFGDRIDGPAGNSMIKYSPQGVVERQLLAAETSTSPGASVASDDPGFTDSRNGENHLWVDADRLMLYMAAPRELIQFDRDGSLQRRLSLRSALEQLARDHGGNDALVLNLAVDGADGSLLIQVRIAGDRPMASILARLPALGARAVTLQLQAVEGAEIGTFRVPLLGKAGHEMLFLNRYTATILRR